MSPATILIVARNAAKTIERAVASALGQVDCPILLVDDLSSDRTVELAKSIGGDRLEVVGVAQHTTLGSARQVGLEKLNTEFAVLLDADDELLPGRVKRLVEVMRDEQTDGVFDEIALYDGATGKFISDLRIPGFLKAGSKLSRIFERNYLPGIGQMGFRVKPIQRIGYDSTLHGPEDSDIVFRALASGLQFSLCREVGYKMYHYEASVSRNLIDQNQQLATVLSKHAYEDIGSRLLESGLPKRIALWALHSNAVFRGDFETARRFLNDLEKEDVDRDSVLEAEGPVPEKEGWRLDFAAGVSYCEEGRFDSAYSRFLGAQKVRNSAEVCNNLGVALAHLDRVSEAKVFFAEALSLYSMYSDAKYNSNAEEDFRVTRLPLRRSASRDVY